MNAACLSAYACEHRHGALGSEAGEKKIPESLGLAPGVVFLVCIILTEQLHAFGISQWLQPGQLFKLLLL